MPKIKTEVTPESATFQENHRVQSAAVDAPTEQLALARTVGGERDAQRHRDRGKLLARERIEGRRRLSSAPSHPIWSTRSSTVSADRRRAVYVDCRLGGAVEAGRTLIVLEAMKMEHSVSAPGSGKLIRLAAAVGDRVESGRILAVVQEAQ